MMQDIPRPLPPRMSYPPRSSGVEKAAVGCGCLSFLIWAAVWGTIIFVAAHFILKYW